MKYQNHSKFPLRKCVLASFVILLCFALVLTLLYAIVNSAGADDIGRIVLIVIISVFAALLVGYWIYQIIVYIEKRKDEN